MRYPFWFAAALAAASVAAGQTPVAPVPAPAPVYRGFAPGATYHDFAARAGALAVRDPLICNTSKHTAQLMECGVLIRDPADSARFYLSAYVLEGKVAMVALYDSAGFGDARGPALVARAQRDLQRALGSGRPIRRGTWEWRYPGGRVVRLAWRSRGAARWISITLTDEQVMSGIRRYLPARH
ncbi:MAG TPA: hypothetical protein VI160_08560 [Gemmatimonadales bacterium]